MRTLVLLAAAVIPASASVTYTLQTRIGGFSVTTADFIPNLLRWDLSSGYRSIYFGLDELGYCQFPNTNTVSCSGAHIDYNPTDGSAYLAQIIADHVDHQNLKGQEAMAQTDLLHTGTFTGRNGLGNIIITQGNDPITFHGFGETPTPAPEPSTFAAALAGLCAMFFRWKTRN